MANEQAGLPLADFIGALRAELRAAALAKDPQLQFNCWPGECGVHAHDPP